MASRRSTTERPEPESRVIGRHGGRVRLYELQGYLFFGSISSLFDRVMGDIETRPDGMETLIFDFARVQGLDVSAVRMIARLDQQARNKGQNVWISGVSRSTEALLRNAGVSDLTQTARSLDEVLVALETEILDQFGKEAEAYAPILAVLAKANNEIDDDYLSEMSFQAGDILFAEGDPSRILICLVVGTMVAETGNGQAVATFNPGALIGEMGFLTGMPRTATVRALSEGRALVVEKSGMEQLHREHPEVASLLMDTLAQIVAHRLERTTKRLIAVENN